MKHMRDFREWLSAANTASAPYQRHLAALTRLDRAQLSNIPHELAWFQQGFPQSVNAA